MTPRDIAFVLLINLIWGLNFAAAKFALVDFAPFFSNALRFLLVALILVPFLRVQSKQMPLLLFAAFMLGVLHFGFMFMAVATGVEVSAVAIVAQLNVPFSALLATLVLAESMGWRRWLAILIAFIGVAVMSFDPGILAHFDAILWTVLSALVYAIVAVCWRKLRDVPAMTIQAWVAVSAVVGSIPATLLLESGQMASLLGAGSAAWLGVAYSALLSTVVGHGGFAWLMKHYEVSVVSPYMLTMPVFGVLGGIVFFDDVLSSRAILGSVLIFLGVTVVTLRNAMKRSPDHTAH